MVAKLNTDLGLVLAESHWYHGTTFTLLDGGDHVAQVALSSHGHDGDADSMALGALVVLPSREEFQPNRADQLAGLLQWVANIARQLNDATADRVAAAQAAAEAERIAREAEREQRERDLADRHLRLLNEFMDEKCRIRVRGSKRWRPVHVRVREVRGEYQPYFEYVNSDRHGPGEYRLSNVRSMEVRVGSRYKSVWDDGQGDLSPWDRVTNRDTAPYDGGL